MRIAITGNIGCGKSTVTQMLAQQLPGYFVGNIDEVVRSLYVDAEYQARLQAEFGTVDRKAISDRLFADPTAKERHEALTMAFVRPKVECLLSAADSIIEFPLFFEMGMYVDSFDFVLVLGCDEATQRSRVLARDGIDDAKFARIRAQQYDVAVKAALGDAYIDTSGTLESVAAQVQAVMPALRRRALKARCLQMFGHDAVWADIVAAYSETHRAYHTLEHLEALFATLAPHLQDHPCREAIELAVWYHDFVYSTELSAYGQNEAASAKALWQACRAYAPHLLERRVAGYSLVGLACEFILATKQHRVTSAYLQGRPELQAACELFLDADLAILSEEPDVVGAYDEKIVDEWRHLGGPTSPEFRSGRAQALKSFLTRDRIYYTPAFASREAQARLNLKRLIAFWWDPLGESNV